MKKYAEMDYKEKKEIAELFGYWLKGYTQEVIISVIVKADEIIANDFAMNLLRELKQRGEEESKDFTRSIESLLDNFDTYREYDPNNHPVTHAKSYRDILRDMYIA